MWKIFMKRNEEAWELLTSVKQNFRGKKLLIITWYLWLWILWRPVIVDTQEDISLYMCSLHFSTGGCTWMTWFLILNSILIGLISANPPGRWEAASGSSMKSFSFLRALIHSFMQACNRTANLVSTYEKKYLPVKSLIC